VVDRQDDWFVPLSPLLVPIATSHFLLWKI
jgi:hypothetical protein